MKKTILTLAALVALSVPAHAAPVTSYQVTGPVLAMTDTAITVQKGTEKWQIARGTATVPGNIKVGDKVTIQYTMTATSVIAKPAK